MNRVTAAARILLVGSGLFVIDSFGPWNRACRVECLTFTLWHGIGILAALVAMAILVLEGMPLVHPGAWTERTLAPLSTMGAGFLLFLTVLKIAVDAAYLAYGAWLGLVLAAVVAYGGYRRWLEGRAGRPPDRQGGRQLPRGP